MSESAEYSPVLAPALDELRNNAGRYRFEDRQWFESNRMQWIHLGMALDGLSPEQVDFMARLYNNAVRPVFRLEDETAPSLQPDIHPID